MAMARAALRQFEAASTNATNILSDILAELARREDILAKRESQVKQRELELERLEQELSRRASACMREDLVTPIPARLPPSPARAIATPQVNSPKANATSSPEPWLSRSSDQQSSDTGTGNMCNASIGSAKHLREMVERRTSFSRLTEYAPVLRPVAEPVPSSWQAPAKGGAWSALPSVVPSGKEGEVEIFTMATPADASGSTKLATIVCTAIAPSDVDSDAIELPEVNNSDEAVLATDSPRIVTSSAGSATSLRLLFEQKAVASVAAHNARRSEVVVGADPSSFRAARKTWTGGAPLTKAVVYQRQQAARNAEILSGGGHPL